MKVSFVIPVFNELELTKECLRTLRSTIGQLDCEIIVVDDGSDASTKDGLRNCADERTSILELPENRGYGHANNQGAMNANGQLLFFLNNDLELQSGWLEPMLAAFDRIPDLGLLGNIQLNAKTGAIDHSGCYADHKTVLQHKRIPNRRLLRSPAYSRFQFVTAACCAIRRDLFLRAGGFDETFVNGCEDYDLCFRLQRLGKHAYVANQSIVRHHVSATRGRASESQERNFRILQRRWQRHIVAISAPRWTDHYVGQLAQTFHAYKGSLARQAIPRWLGLKKGAPSAGLSIAHSALQRKERHWAKLLDRQTDEQIKQAESARHPAWLKNRFQTEGLHLNGNSGKGVWIKEKAILNIPAGITIADFEIAGYLSKANRTRPEESGKLGLKITVNDLEIRFHYPIQEGGFRMRFEDPPMPIEQNHKIVLELAGTRQGNAYAYLGRILRKFPIIPKFLSAPLQPYRNQALNQRLSLLEFRLNDETVLDFEKTPAAPLNFDYLRLHGNIGINLIGWFKAELGIGESVRLAAKALKASEIDHSLVPLRVNCKAPHGDQTFANQLTGKADYAVNVFHIDAPQAADIDHHHGPKLRSDKRNIGYWAWELPEFPDEWIPYFDYFDEIWTPSDFVREAIAMKSPHPVIKIPHCIEFPIPSGDHRRAFGLPKDKFLVCFAYDLNSYQERKNPKAVIEAFRQAFLGADRENDAALVIKTHSTRDNPQAYRELQDALVGIENYHLIDQTLSRGQVYGLMQACDTYASLHRSEGFGLTVAESMFLGKPVISTDWSATAEFLNARNGCPIRCKLQQLERTYGPYAKGQIWADPDPAHAAEQMYRLANDSQWAAKLGREARATIQDKFSPKRIGELYQARLRSIALW